MKTKFSRAFLIILFLISSTYSIAQYGLRYNWITTIPGEETIVIPSEFSSDALEKAFKEQWKLNKYRIVSKDEVLKNIDQYRDNPKYVFITIKIQESNRVANSSSRVMIFSKKINAKAEGSSTTIISAGVTELTDNLYTDEAELRKDLTVINAFATMSKDDYSKVFKPDPSIKNKTLLIPKSTLTEKAIQDMNNLYPFKYKILDKEELSKEMLNGNTENVLYEITYYTVPVYSVIDLNTGKILFNGGARGSGTSNYFNIKMLAGKLK